MNYQRAVAKMSLIAVLVLILDAIKIVRGQSEDGVCYDISPYCSEEDCWIRPGYAVEYCRKTCGDCQDSLCYDSEYFPCVGMDLSGCDKYLKDYCPVLCGICDPVDGESSSEESNPSDHTKSTFLGLFEPSQWIGAIFNPSSTTEKFTEPTTAMPTMSIEAKTHSPTISPSLETTKSTIMVVPTSTTTVPITMTTSTTILTSTSTSTPTSTTMLPTSSKIPPTSTTPTTMSALSSNVTGSSITTTVPDCKTETSSNSIMETSTIAAPAGLEMSTTAYVPEMERGPVIHTPDEYTSYLRQLSVAGQSSTKQTTRAPIIISSFSPPRPRTKTANNISRLPGVSGANKVTAIAPPIRPPPTPKSPMTMTTFARAPQIIFHRTPRVRIASPEEISRARQSSAGIAGVSKTFLNRPPGRSTPPPPPPPMARHTASIADIVTLLGCRDRDEKTCSQINEFSCHARPGYYLKLCPVKCKNCNGLLCYDSNKIDCAKVVESGGCQVPNAAEYCPQSCNECPKPSYLNDSGSRCKDEFPTCKNLAASGICHHIYNVETLRLYCAKSCGFCKESPFYFMDANQYYPQYYQRRTLS